MRGQLLIHRMREDAVSRLCGMDRVPEQIAVRLETIASLPGFIMAFEEHVS